MANFALRSAQLTMGFQVSQAGASKKVKREFPLSVVDTSGTQPNAAQRDQVIWGLRSAFVVGNVIHAQHRRRADLVFPFDNDPAQIVKSSAVRIRLELLDKTTNEVLCRFVEYSVQPDDDSTFVQPDDLKVIPLHAFLLATGTSGAPRYELYHVVPQGGGADPKCSGCDTTSSPKKQKQCALCGCYGQP
jgi:hypothetical protein